MAELEKNKAGLQKKVSSVFKGVPIPQGNSTQQPSGAPAPNRTADVSPKPTSGNHQISQSSLIKKLQQSEESLDKVEPEHTTTSPKPTPTDRQMSQSPPVEKFHEPEESLDEAAPAKQPQSKPPAEVARRSLGQQIKDKFFAPKPDGVSTTRQKAMVILVPVLAIVMIFMFRQVLSKPPRKTKGATQDDAPVVAVADSGNEIDWQIPEPLPAMMRDPLKFPDESGTQNSDQINTRGEGQNKTETGTIDVRDIVYSADKPSAVIDTQIVHVGDTIHGVTIIKINRDSIEFEKDGKTWVQKIRD